jgi:hypothetical protein
MAKFRLHRRAVLKGAGTVAIALPWLEIMGQGRRARAQTTTMPAKRFVTVYQPGGTVRRDASGRDRYSPTGTETSFTLSPILAPLEAVKSKILVIDGLDMKAADQTNTAFMGMVEQHQGGIMSWLTGAVQPGHGMFVKAPSIDQLLAPRLSAGKSKSSIQMAVRWATGKSKGRIHPINAVNFEAASPYSPIPPRLDPQEIFTTFFGNIMAGGTPMVDANTIALMRKKSILDFVDRKYVSLSARLGAADRMRLEQHLEKLRKLEMSINIMPPTVTTVCKQPTRIDTMDYKPDTGLNSSDNGSVRDIPTDTAIPKVGKFMMDMTVMALACDLTGVISFQWSDTEAKHTFPWLNLTEHHHFYQHDGGFKPVECERICTWYSEQNAYLLSEMQKVDMGGHSLLDESVVFFGSELQDPPAHLKGNMPFMLAGGAGMRTGRWLKYTGNRPHNDLLISILNLFGDTRTTIGDSRFVTGALPNLT